MAWDTSTRRHRLPPNWHTLRTQVRDRAQGQCQAATHHPHCDGLGHDADHITPGDTHTLNNLAWLNHNCHKAKTAQETAARNAARTRRRPEEQHPGLL